MRVINHIREIRQQKGITQVKMAEDLQIKALRWAWDPFVAPFIGRKVDQLATMLPVLLIPLIGGAGLLVLLALTEQVLLLLVFIICFQLLSTVYRL